MRTRQMLFGLCKPRTSRRWLNTLLEDQIPIVRVSQNVKHYDSCESWKTVTSMLDYT